MSSNWEELSLWWSNSEIMMKFIRLDKLNISKKSTEHFRLPKLMNKMNKFIVRFVSVTKLPKIILWFPHVSAKELVLLFMFLVYRLGLIVKLKDKFMELLLLTILLNFSARSAKHLSRKKLKLIKRTLKWWKSLSLRNLILC